MPFDATPAIVDTYVPEDHTWASKHLSPREHGALVCVRDDLRSGKIPSENFNMNTFTSSRSCGTVHCIGGWMTTYMRMEFSEAEVLHTDTRFQSLFFGYSNCSDFSPTAAADTIDHFFATGVGWQQLSIFPSPDQGYLIPLNLLLF